MFITKKHLPRRTFLQGRRARRSRCRCSTRWFRRGRCWRRPPASRCPRLGFVYVPHGAIMDKWTPATEGAGFEFTPILKPLEPFRDHLNVVSGLGHRAADTTAVHSLSPTTWLSGVRPKADAGRRRVRGRHRRPDRRAGRSVRTRCCRRWSSRPRITRA